MSQVSAQGTRDELRRRLIDAFSARPEVHSIHTFGREVGGVVDEYSDVDIIVCSNDLAASQRDCLRLLGQISPVIGTYYIRCEPAELAVMAMLKDRESHSIVKSSLDLCRELGLRSVAEGVESRAHWTALSKMGCDVVQGYYIARPFPIDQLPGWWLKHEASFRR